MMAVTVVHLISFSRSLFTLSVFSLLVCFHHRSSAVDVDKETTIGFGSCLMQSKFLPHEAQGYRPYKILGRLAKRSLDSFVFMGDAVYADFPHFYASGCCSRPPYPTCDEQCFENGSIGSAAQLDAQYALLFQDTFFAVFLEWIPTVFTWDDHELFDNYREGKEHVYYKSARRAFEKHLTSKFNPTAYRPGELYFVHRVPARPSKAVVEIFVLDGRSHRSQQSLIGDQQYEDLKKWLSTPIMAKWRIIVSSTMFADVASGVGSDNWSKYPHEKRKVLNAIYDAGVGGVFVFSGDAHFVATVEHHAQSNGRRCKLVEFCSSPLASVPLKPTHSPQSYTGRHDGFDERVKFLRSGDHLYATAHFHGNLAVVRFWSYQENLYGEAETLLAETVLNWENVCTAPGDEPPADEL